MLLIQFNPNEFSSLEPELYYLHLQNKKMHAYICTEDELDASFQMVHYLKKGFRQLIRNFGILENSLGGHNGVGPPLEHITKSFTLSGLDLVKAAAKLDP